MLKIARLTFLTMEQGGRDRPLSDGVVPLIKIRDLFTMCRISASDQHTEFVPGGTYEVVLTIPLRDVYGFTDHDLAGRVEMYDGPKSCFATGIML